MDRLPPSPNHRASLALLALVFLGLALLPRTLGLADFLTTDEAYHWIDRTTRFSTAIAGHAWADTLQTGHPGVTTMWLGSIGLALEQAVVSRDPHIPALVTQLAWLRLPMAIIHALVVALAFLLLHRLFGHMIALIASGLWATAPYLIAHGRLLHLDANLTDCVMLSILLLLAAFTQRPATTRPAHVGYLSASGVCAGLALLTKGPALILLPFAGLAILAMVFHNQQPALVRSQPLLRSRAIAFMRCIPQAVLLYCGWLTIAALVVIALWPALWVTPGLALERYIGEITSNGGRPNGDGQFFFGRADADPGPLFYPVADLFRSTPAMLLGLIAGTVVGLKWLIQRRWTRDPRSPAVRNLLIMLVFVCFWTLVMTLGPKKFDRYILPTWPALIILAAAGLASILAHIPRRWLRTTILGLGFASELLIVAWYQPYYLSYYNPLLGGGRVAQQVFLIGWGEGMDQVGAYLRERPDLSYGPVLSALGATLQPFVPVDVRDVEDFGRLPANYAVVYRESLQRAANPALYAQLQTTIPLHTITIHGIEYAWIYQLPRPFAQPIDASFGEALRLRGVTIEQTAERVTITPAWDVRAKPASAYNLFVHLLNAQGARVAELNLSPGGGSAPSTNNWQAGQQIAVPLPLDLPPNLAPGQYQLVIGVYDIATGARLQLTGGTPANPALAGDNALLVATLNLP